MRLNRISSIPNYFLCHQFDKGAVLLPTKKAAEECLHEVYMKMLGRNYKIRVDILSSKMEYPGRLLLTTPVGHKITMYFFTFTSENNSKQEYADIFIPDDVFERTLKRFRLSYSDMMFDQPVSLEWFIRNVYYQRVKRPKKKEPKLSELDEFLDSYMIY